MVKLTAKNRKVLSACLFILPGIIFVFFLTFYPLTRVAWMSFFSLDSESKLVFSISNYKNAFSDILMWKSLWHSLYFTIISVSIHFLLGLSLALLINNIRKNRISIFFRGLLFLPWLFASAVWCVTWKLILHPQFSILNEIFTKIGINSLARGWLSEPNLLPLTSLSIVNGLKFFPFHMVMLFASLQAVPKELYEVADIDGASSFQKFKNVTLPFLKHTIILITTIDTIWTFHYFDLVWILTEGGPMNKTEVLSTYIYKIVFKYGGFDYGSSLAIILMVILCIFMFIYMKTFIREDVET